MANAQQRMIAFTRWVQVLGYRAPTRKDLVAGAELLMIDVEHYFDSHQGLSFCATGHVKVKLDEVPVVEDVVMFHRTFPVSKQQCFVGVKEFCAEGYRKGRYMNDHRFVMKVTQSVLSTEGDQTQSA